MLVTETGYEVLTVSAGSPPPPAFVSAALRPPPRMRRGARPGRPETATLPSLRSRFRDGKAALIEHFRLARPTGAGRHAADPRA